MIDIIKKLNDWWNDIHQDKYNEPCVWCGVKVGEKHKRHYISFGENT